MAHEVQVGNRKITLETFSARKGLRVLRLLEHTANAFPEIQKHWGDYVREYEQTHTVDLDRAAARAAYPPQPLTREEPVIGDQGQVVTDDDGRPLVRREPVIENGKVLVGPDPLGHLTDADWAASDQKLRQPRQPTWGEQLIAVLPQAIELAEGEVAKLLGLIAMSNADVARYGKEGLESLWARAGEFGDELLDADLDQVIELAVAAGESVNETYQIKVVERLGERLGSALRLIGFNPPSRKPTATSTETSSSPPTTTNPTSSTDSQPPTDGPSPESSTEPASAESEVSLIG
jgi:hypothetical protein